MIHASWEQIDGQRLIIRQHVSGLLRALVGGPLLCLGLGMLYLCLSAPVSFYAARGWAGVAEGIPGMLVTGLLAACIAPLGWWITFARASKEIDAARGEVREITDWRLGRQVRICSVGSYRGIRVEVERLVPSRASRETSRTVYVNIVRLVPYSRRDAGPLDLAMFERGAEMDAVELARTAAILLGLPLENARDRARHSRSPQTPEQSAGTLGK